MYWKYSNDPEWLKVRKAYLTASDIASLFDGVKTTPRESTIKEKLKAYAFDKYGDTPQETESFGAAARGHVLEPYAIEEYNLLGLDRPTMHQWESASICNKDNMLLWSPDGMPYQQDEENSSYLYPVDELNPIEVMLEVKCYSPREHLAAIESDSKTRKERWQIATAMLVVPTLTEADVFFYNPNSFIPFHINTYTRDTLKQELEYLNNVVLPAWEESKKIIEELKAAYVERFGNIYPVYSEYLINEIENK